jgi:hypothetical protein
MQDCDSFLNRRPRLVIHVAGKMPSLDPMSMLSILEMGYGLCSDPKSVGVSNGMVGVPGEPDEPASGSRPIASLCTRERVPIRQAISGGDASGRCARQTTNKLGGTQ